MTQLMPLDIFDPSSYPTRRDEEWRYSDLSRALRDAPKPARNVWFDDPDVEQPPQRHQLLISNGNAYTRMHPLIPTDTEKFGLHHIAWSNGGDILGHQAEADVVVEKDQKLFIFETYCGWIHYDTHGQVIERNDDPYVGNTVLRFRLEEGAHLTRVVLLEEAEAAISIRRSTVETSPNSVFKQYVFSTGAKFQRFETHVRHAGHGAEVVLDGAYLLKDKRHFDLTTRVTHVAANGTTSQTIRGLVKDQASAVFQGRILVERGADGTDARMRHQALILNDGAHIRAKPELEIYADDVQCAHGNTIGALDEEALFFCKARGMDEATARGLLTHAFVLPVADGIEDEEIRGKVLKFLEEAAEDYHAV